MEQDSKGKEKLFYDILKTLEKGKQIIANKYIAQTPVCNILSDKTLGREK